MVLPKRSFRLVTLSGMVEMALLISSMVILSHSSWIACFNASVEKMTPLLFNLCLIVRQRVSMGLRSGEFDGWASHLIPSLLLACLTLLSTWPFVL
jgi:hypothetical protein